MSKVTSKLQVTIPKAIAEQYGITPGTEVHFEPAGEAIRVCVDSGPHRSKGLADLEWRLRLFDAATRRQDERNARWTGPRNPPDRGWRREDLYDRDLPR